ncbi:MAG: restriction endonuclease [Proteobacteria bacterium]|nr:restriction endonuclease [Pseudomonadota bacterium]
MDNSKEHKWKLFEKLVTAIHVAEGRGAEVFWDKKINGRQFDVVIKFKHGFYEYLTVIECKNYANPISVEKVEAFVTKSQDANADKAIVVSSSGFQEGCFNVAKIHNVELYTLNEISKIPDKLLSSQLTPALNIYDVELTLSKGKKVKLPKESNKFTYFIYNSVIYQGEKTCSIQALIEKELRKNVAIPKQVEQILHIAVDLPCRVSIPTIIDNAQLSKITLKYKLIIGRPLKSNQNLDLHVARKLFTNYEYKDVLKGTKIEVEGSKLRIGIDTTLQPGKFYINNLGFYYYCDSLDGTIATVYLVESYQHGRLLQTGRFQIETKHADHYLEVTEKHDIKRLKNRLNKLKNAEKSNSERKST